MAMRICLLLAVTTILAGAEAVPDPQQVRAGIAALVESVRGPGTPPTLGLVHEVVGLAISYGAPAYNAGDRAGCGDFYVETAGTLVTAFADGRPTGPLARQALDDLAAAKLRFAADGDAERRAWTMRLAFDLVNIAWEGECERGAAFSRLAVQYLQRGQYPEAEAAAERGEEIRLETLASRPMAVALDLRVAPLVCAQALLGQERYGEAGERLAAGLDGLGDLAGSRLDLHGLHPAGGFAGILAGLERHVQEHGDDHDALALLAFEQRFGGASERAADTAARLRAAAPTHPLVRWWDEAAKAAAAPVPPASPAKAAGLH
jgi:hypothetical protein